MGWEGFAILDRSAPGFAAPLRLRSGLWPPAIGKERWQFEVRRISTPPSQQRACRGPRLCAARLLNATLCRLGLGLGLGLGDPWV